MQLLKEFELNGYSVFPVVVVNKSSNHPDNGIFKIVSASKIEDTWRQSDHYANMQSWNDVFKYYLLQIQQLEALVACDNGEDRAEMLAEMNPAPKVVGLDEYSLLGISENGLEQKVFLSNLQSTEPDWKSILAAWEHSLAKLLLAKKQHKLIEP